MPTVLITGASRGLGLEFARSFATDGWTVHAACRRPAKATALAELAPQVERHRLDVTDALQVAALARRLGDEPIDLLLNNAGIYGPKTAFGESDYESWLGIFNVNTLGPMRMTEAFVEHVARSERRLIVNVTSRLGSIGENSGGRFAYRSSKAALNMIGNSLAIELKPRGITVLMVHPGWVQTDMGGPSASITPEQSIAGLRKVFDRATPADSGRFFDWKGEEVRW
ncbi:MAG: SDR family oxidoreductase [Kiloniellales bacterium]